MTPVEIQSALDHDLFVTREKRVVELLSIIVKWADSRPWYALDERVRDAIIELKEISRA